jgi:hypothetical protein
MKNGLFADLNATRVTDYLDASSDAPTLLTRFATLTGGECGVLRNRAPTTLPTRSVTRRRPRSGAARRQ